MARSTRSLSIWSIRTSKGLVAILFEEGSGNSMIESSWQSIAADKEKALDVPSVSVNLQEFPPEELGYFRFTAH